MRTTNPHSPFTLNLKNTGDVYFLKREPERTMSVIFERFKTVFILKNFQKRSLDSRKRSCNNAAILEFAR